MQCIWDASRDYRVVKLSGARFKSRPWSVALVNGGRVTAHSGEFRTKEEALIHAADLAQGLDAAADLAWFSDQHSLELSHYGPTYCDDDDQSVEWRVHQQVGGINDRERWLVGRGQTAAEAIAAARRALSTSKGDEA